MKGDKPKEQTIGFWSDKIRKISKNFYIVRESNKTKNGYHFHALVALELDDIKKSWFIKHTHINVKTIGDVNPSLTTPSFPDSQEEEEFLIHGDDPSYDLSDRLVAIFLYKQKTKLAQTQTKNKRHLHVDRILSYMDKEDHIVSSQFQDYCFCKNGKQVAIATPLNP